MSFTSVARRPSIHKASWSIPTCTHWNQASTLVASLRVKDEHEAMKPVERIRTLQHITHRSIINGTKKKESYRRIKVLEYRAAAQGIGGRCQR